MTAAAASPPDLRRAARRGLAIYFALVVVFSGAIEAYLIMNPGLFGSMIWVLALMWSPALASVIARLVLREGFSDVSFRPGGRRALPWYALGLVVPLAVGFLAYGAAWLTSLARFDPQAEGLVATLVGDTASPVTVFLVSLVLAATLGVAFGVLSATGEEIGWRGYMLTRLIDAGVG